jgi:hypothetical protein
MGTFANSDYKFSAQEMKGAAISVAGMNVQEAL